MSELHEDLYALVVYLHADCNRDLLEAIAHEQLPFSQLLLLERLRGGRLRPSVRQAASIMHVTPAGASRIIDSLARRGLIRREADDNDFRSKRLLITERGEATIARLHAARLQRIHLFTRELTADERDALEHALGRLAERPPIRACRPPRTDELAHAS